MRFITGALLWPFKVLGLLIIAALLMVIAGFCEATDTED